MSLATKEQLIFAVSDLAALYEFRQNKTDFYINQELANEVYQIQNAIANVIDVLESKIAATPGKSSAETDLDFDSTEEFVRTAQNRYQEIFQIVKEYHADERQAQRKEYAVGGTKRGILRVGLRALSFGMLG